MIIHPCIQGTAEWKELKRGIPSASEFSRILTPAKGELSKSIDAYACELVAERYGIGAMDSMETYQSAAMANGVQLEPEARRCFEFDQGVRVKQVGFVTTDTGSAGCSPDGLIVGRDCGLELKAPNGATHIRWMLDNILPLDHKAQVHGGMAVTGFDEWFFCSYVPGLPTFIIHVSRDDFTTTLEDALRVFDARLHEIIATLNLPEPGRHEEVALPDCFAI